jgi:hypothetical protein
MGRSLYLRSSEENTMGPELILALLSVLISLLSGGIAIKFHDITRIIFEVLTGRYEKRLTYSDRLQELTGSLMKASREVDALFREMEQVATDRSKVVEKLESDFLDLEAREKELKKRIEHLQNVPIPVAEHFAKLTASGESRSARRDYILFGAGVFVSTAIAILLKVLGLG